MPQNDPAILRAEKLRIIQSMPEYKDTIGKFLREAREAALHDMRSAKEPHEFHNSQGAFNAVEALMQQIQKVYDAEQAAIAKREKRKVISE